ncbi:hypothetical protein C8R47DRAFT_431900 [Mycena vitilis]|nr:hypothetical protein C8R47DRAFT_431900 [Mycena vitilis]
MSIASLGRERSFTLCSSLCGLSLRDSCSSAFLCPVCCVPRCGLPYANFLGPQCIIPWSASGRCGDRIAGLQTPASRSRRADPAHVLEGEREPLGPRCCAGTAAGTLTSHYAIFFAFLTRPTVLGISGHQSQSGGGGVLRIRERHDYARIFLTTSRCRLAAHVTRLLRPARTLPRTNHTSL